MNIVIMGSLGHIEYPLTKDLVKGTRGNRRLTQRIEMADIRLAGLLNQIFN